MGGRVLRSHIQDHGAIFCWLENRRGIQVGHLAIALDWVVLAEWMSFPVLGHHDAPQIGMAEGSEAK